MEFKVQRVKVVDSDGSPTVLVMRVEVRPHDGFVGVPEFRTEDGERVNQLSPTEFETISQGCRFTLASG